MYQNEIFYFNSQNLKKVTISIILRSKNKETVVLK